MGFLMKPFSETLSGALEQVARKHGSHYIPGAACAWGLVCAAYIGFVLLDFPANQLRAIQYYARETYGPIIMDCQWYSLMKQICLDTNGTAISGIPSKDGNLKKAVITGELLVEALDFCREG